MPYPNNPVQSVAGEHRVDFNDKTDIVTNRKTRQHGPLFMMTIPNLLTLFRLVLLIPICLLMMGGWFSLFFAFVLYVIAAFTDYADGWWARTYNAGSDFGRMLDPIVDKIFVATLFLMLVANETLMGAWIALPIVILTREFLVSGVREYLGPKRITIPVSKLAKWKTTVQMIAIGLLIFPVGAIQVLGLVLLLAASILTVVTAVHYLSAVPWSKMEQPPTPPVV